MQLQIHTLCYGMICTYKLGQRHSASTSGKEGRRRSGIDYVIVSAQKFASLRLDHRPEVAPLGSGRAPLDPRWRHSGRVVAEYRIYYI